MGTKKCVTQTRMWLKWADYKGGLPYYNSLLPNVPMQGSQAMNFNIGHTTIMVSYQPM